MVDHRCGGVVATPDALSEERGGRSIVTVPRDAIRSIALLRGPRGERPIAQALFALVLCGVGFFAGAALLSELARRDTVHLTLAYVLPAFPLGAWLVWSAFRPADYLLVRTRNDARKLIFEGGVRPEERAEFVRRVKDAYGYVIEDHEGRRRT